MYVLVFLFVFAVFLSILFTVLIIIVRQKNIFVFFWIWWLTWIDAVLYSTLITSYSACKLQLQIPNSCRVRSSLTCVAFFNRCTLLRRAFRLSICHFANLLLGNTNWVIMQVMFLILMTQSGVLYIKSIQKGLHKFSWKQLPATVAVKLVFCFVARKFNCSKWSAWLKPRHFNLRLIKCAGRRKRGGLRGRGWGCRMQCGLQVLQGWACDFCVQDKSGMNWGETFCRACSMNSETHGFPFTVCWFTMIYNDLHMLINVYTRGYTMGCEQVGATLVNFHQPIKPVYEATRSRWIETVSVVPRVWK